jgi:glutathione S-transferase
MKLFHSPASPFVRKVMIVLHETGQTADVELIDSPTTATNTNPALAVTNPLGRLPALARDGGCTLHDSRVICRYLNDRAGADLYPNSGDAQWRTLVLEATADGIMECAVSMVYEVRLRPEEKQWDEWQEVQWTKVTRSLKQVESEFREELQGLSGDRPVTAGLIALGAALGYLDFRHDARDWRSIAPELATWFGEFSQRESMTASAPD